MRPAAALVLLVLLAQSTAQADVLKMKSGETKSGRILAESEGQILFQSADGIVGEVPASSVSILDRSDVSKKGGNVSFFSSSIQKTPKSVSWTLPGSSAADGAQGQQAAGNLDNMDKMLQAWLEKHPEAKVWLEAAAEKALQKSSELDSAIAEAKKQN